MITNDLNLLPIRPYIKGIVFPTNLYISPDKYIFFDKFNKVSWVIPRDFPYRVDVVKGRTPIWISEHFSYPSLESSLVSPTKVLGLLSEIKDHFGTYYLHRDLVKFIEEKTGERLYYPYPFDLDIEYTTFLPYGVGVIGMHRKENLMTLLYIDPVHVRFSRIKTVIDKSLRESIADFVLQIKAIAKVNEKEIDNIDKIKELLRSWSRK